MKRDERRARRAQIDATRTRLGWAERVPEDLYSHRARRRLGRVSSFRLFGHAAGSIGSEFDRLTGGEAVFMDDRFKRRLALAPTDGFLEFVAMGG